MPKKMMGITTYSLPEVAETLGVTPRSVHNYLKDGLIAGSKIGGRWAFTEKQIQDYITKGSLFDKRADKKPRGKA